MGQIVEVVERPSARPGIVRFETNRALSGMGHDRYEAGQRIEDNRPTDELARRIFARGGVLGVHVNGSVITVDLEKGYDADGIAEIVRGLYTFYLDPGEELAPGDPRAVVAARNQELQEQFEAAEAAAAAAAAAAKAEEDAAAATEDAPAAEDAPSTEEAPSTGDAPAAEEAEGHGEVDVEPAEVTDETPADAPAAEAPADAPADPAE